MQFFKEEKKSIFLLYLYFNYYCFISAVIWINVVHLSLLHRQNFILSQMLKWCCIHLLRDDHKSPFVLWRRQLNNAPSCFQKSSESLVRVLCNLSQTYSYLIDNTKTINTKTPAHFSPTEALMYAYTLTVLRHVPLDHCDNVCMCRPDAHFA